MGKKEKASKAAEKKSKAAEKAAKAAKKAAKRRAAKAKELKTKEKSSKKKAVERKKKLAGKMDFVRVSPTYAHPMMYQRNGHFVAHTYHYPRGWNFGTNP